MRVGIWGSLNLGYSLSGQFESGLFTKLPVLRVVPKCVGLKVWGASPNNLVSTIFSENEADLRLDYLGEY